MPEKSKIKSFVCLIKHHQLKMYGAVGVFFLMSSLDGDEWLALLLPHLPPGKGGWVGPTIRLDSLENRYIFRPACILVTTLRN